MKDLQYITHDLGARNDPKLLKLQMEMGGQGLAIFWCLVEMLWENDGYLPTDYDALAFNLRWTTAPEVERVVTMYGLFVHDDTEHLFWSQSALERIAQKKQRLSVRENSARNAANARWGRAGSATAVPTECAAHADAVPINKDINIDRNKERDNSNNRAPLTAANLLEIFFFENMKDPAGEVKRFTEYYEGRGWTYLDGTPVTDTERAARDWKPKLPGKRFDTEALQWYRAVWSAAKPRMANASVFFIDGVSGIRRSDQKISIVFRNQPAAYAVGGFIQDNDLAGDYKIDYRIES